MIDSRELRLGNLIMEPYDNMVEAVDTLTETEVNGEPSDYFSPIPLTEEWLVRLGFTCVSRYSFHNYALPNNFIISMWMEDKPTAGFEEKGVCYWGEYFTAIKFVHQLQNLYFTFTGQELLINPKSV